jgi:hypothetical protein
VQLSKTHFLRRSLSIRSQATETLKTLLVLCP